MTIDEMRRDIIERYYKNTIELLDGLPAREKQDILHEVCITMSMSFEKIPCHAGEIKT